MKTYVLVLLMSLIAACKTGSVILRSNDQGAYYAMYKYKSADKDSALIYGRVRTEDSDFPMGVLYVNKSMHIIDSLGSYKIKLRSGRYNLSASALSNNGVIIRSLNLHGGDSIRIDFFLTPSYEHY